MRAEGRRKLFLIAGELSFLSPGYCTRPRNRVRAIWLLNSFTLFFIVFSATDSANAQQPADKPKNSSQSQQNSSPTGVAGDGGAEKSLYKPLRYEEDWSYLRDKSKRKDFFDAIKYIPFGRENFYLTIGGDIKPRYEYFNNEAWGAAQPKDRNGYFLQRYMLHFDFNAGRRFRAFFELKSGIENGRRGEARQIDENYLDVNQAFFDVGLGKKVKVSGGESVEREVPVLTVRAGRQEMSFGAGRLVATREGTNVRQRFDGVRAIVQTGKWRVDGFVVKPVEIDRRFFDDEPIHQTTFWGVYAVRSAVNFLPGKGNADFYYFGR